MSVNVFLYHGLSWNVELNYLDTLLEDSIKDSYYIHKEYQHAEFYILRNYIEKGNVSVLLGEASLNKIDVLLNKIASLLQSTYSL